MFQVSKTLYTKVLDNHNQFVQVTSKFTSHIHTVDNIALKKGNNDKL